MQVSIRELKANPARAIAMVRPGQPVQITSHRKVVAQLVVPDQCTVQPTLLTDEDAIQRIMASGMVATAATKPWRLPTPVAFEPSPDGKTMSDLVTELRGPR